MVHGTIREPDTCTVLSTSGDETSWNVRTFPRDFIQMFVDSGVYSSKIYSYSRSFVYFVQSHDPSFIRTCSNLTSSFRKDLSGLTSLPCLRRFAPVVHVYETPPWSDSN